MNKLTEQQMATIATQAWYGYCPAATARRLGISADAVMAYRVSRAGLARIARIADYYAQTAKQSDTP